MQSVILIAHNLRSAHNVGSLLRTCDGLGVTKVYLTGYTPHPAQKVDERLPHLAQKIDRQINKTALGAEATLAWEYQPLIETVLDKLKQRSYEIAALEQAENSVKLNDFTPPEKLAVIVGREVEGIEPEVLALADQIIEIPMHGQKESFNVTVAAAIALYHCLHLQSQA